MVPVAKESGRQEVCEYEISMSLDWPVCIGSRTSAKNKIIHVLMHFRSVGDMTVHGKAFPFAVTVTSAVI